MAIGGVVDDPVKQHGDARVVRSGDEPVEVVEGAERRMHARVVEDVVAEVEVRRRMDRRQPDRVGAQVPDVVEPGQHAGEIADPVA
jgi:hypothetical protein